MMAIQLGTFETTWSMCLNLRALIFKRIPHPLHVPVRGYFRELNILPSLNNVLLFFFKCIFQSLEQFVNAKCYSAECVLLVASQCHSKCSFVYSPSCMIRPLTSLPNLVVNLGRRDSRCSSPSQLAVENSKGYLSHR